MNLRRTLPPIVLGVIVVLAGLITPGCGDASGDEEPQSQTTSQSSQKAIQAASEPSQAFDEVVNDLRSAALSSASYKAIRQANALKAPEEAVIDAFCETVWQIDTNREAEKLSNTTYIAGRLIRLAELYAADANPAAIKAAMDKLRAKLDVASLDGGLNKRYKDACYR